MGFSYLKKKSKIEIYIDTLQGILKNNNKCKEKDKRKKKCNKKLDSSNRDTEEKRGQTAEGVDKDAP